MITVEQALATLKLLSQQQRANDRVLESDHEDADLVLLKLIDNPEITEAYDGIEKWYA